MSDPSGPGQFPGHSGPTDGPLDGEAAGSTSRGRASVPVPGAPAAGIAPAGNPPSLTSTTAGKSAKTPKAPKAKKHRSPLWAKLSIGVGTLAMIASVGMYTIYQGAIHELNTTIKTVHVLTSDPATVLQLVGNTIKGPINVLMVGVDATGHTDSIIIAHIPATHDEVYLISLPRDTRVNTLSGGTNKINAVYGNGDMAALQKTIKLNWGIVLNAALIINFNGFGSIVTKLGGIDMYVDETTYSIHHGYLNNDPNQHAKGYPYKINPNTGVPICNNHHYKWGDTHDDPSICTLPGISEVIYPKGMYHFDAYSALDFVRCRDGLDGTDYGRQRHQQQFIKAVLAKAYAKGMADPLQLLGIAKSMSNAFTFDNNGIPLEDWLFTLEKIGPTSLVTIKTNNGKVTDPPKNSPPDGHGSEQGLTSDTLKLLADVRDDKGVGDPVGRFLVDHPEWVATT
jgi:polyisoprenyl-teichoic acid--peptidoglycan teichoic acid transferase